MLIKNSLFSSFFENLKEAGFLCALVLRLKPILFSPGDYVCRKGKLDNYFN